MIFSNKFSVMVLRHFRTIVRFLSVSKIANIAVAGIEYFLRKTKVRSRPFVFRIDPSTACNLRCPGCEAHAQKTNEKRILTLTDFKKYLSRIEKYCVRLSLYDSGEPLVNKDVFEMVKLTGDAAISSYINSNFNLFREEKHLESLFGSNLTTLAISIDGMDQESYKRYRVRGNFDRVLDSLETVLKERRNLGIGPSIEIHVLDLDHLREKKLEIIRFFESKGVDRVVWKEETWGFNEERTESDSADSRCYWLYSAAMIRPDGMLYPCCGRGFGRLAYGDLNSESVDEIWNNEYYQFSRRLFQQGADLPYDPRMQNVPCLTCDVFSKQRGMSSNSNSKPKHIPLTELS